MTTRRRFTGDFKARVALEALRGDQTVQGIAARHKVHPNQVSTWKHQAIEGMEAIFSTGADRERQDRETEVRDLHAKIGQLTVERDFLSKGLKR
jgi:transposase